MPSQHPRCAQHCLVVAPDGLCVLCRREAGATQSYAPPLSAAQPSPAAGPWKYLALAGFLLLTAAGVAAALKLASAGSKPPPSAVAMVKVPELAEPPELSPSEQSALDRSKAADLAVALERLGAAEAQRKAQQQLAAAELDQQRQAALATQQKEQLARDQARHEKVARELEEQAWRKHRGDVRITMYSTEWCGVCKRARTYMHKQNIPFNDLDIEHDDAAKLRAQALNPRNSVPTITIDKELLIGFSPEALEERIVRASHAYKL